MNNRWKNQVRSSICRFPECPETKIYCQHYCRRDYDRLWRNKVPFDTYLIRQVLECERPNRQAVTYADGRWTNDQLMAEWDFMRGFAAFETFGARVGIKQESWEQAFRRAKAAGDPRARRASNDPATWPDPAKWTARMFDARRRDKGVAG